MDSHIKSSIRHRVLTQRMLGACRVRQHQDMPWIALMEPIVELRWNKIRCISAWGHFVRLPMGLAPSFKPSPNKNPNKMSASLRPYEPGLCGKGRCSSNSAICLGTYPFMNIPAEWHTRRVVRSTDRWWKLETTGLLNRPTIGPLRWLLSSGRRGAFDFASIIDDSTGGKGGDPPPLPQLATSSWPISPYSTWLVDLGRYQGTRTIVPKQRYHPRRPVPIQTDAFRSVQCVRNPPEAKGLRTRLPEVVQVFCLSWWRPDPR